MKKRFFPFLAMCLLLAAMLSAAGCSDVKRDDLSDGQETMNIDIGENGMIRNGTAYETYQVEEGQKGIISVGISRESGRLDLDIYPAENEDSPGYTGRDLDSTSFDVILTDPGEYKVRITAKEFSGDWGFSWRTENNKEE